MKTETPCHRIFSGKTDEIYPQEIELHKVPKKKKHTYNAVRALDTGIPSQSPTVLPLFLL